MQGICAIVTSEPTGPRCTPEGAIFGIWAEVMVVKALIRYDELSVGSLDWFGLLAVEKTALSIVAFATSEPTRLTEGSFGSLGSNNDC